MTVIATDALVATEDIATQNDIWSTKATLYGSLVASVTEMNFRYRALGSNDWMYSNQAVLNNKIFTSQITGLEPGITYEYQAMAGTVAAKETNNSLQKLLRNYRMPGLKTGMEVLLFIFIRVVEKCSGIVVIRVLLH